MNVTTRRRRLRNRAPEDEEALLKACGIAAHIACLLNLCAASSRIYGLHDEFPSYTKREEAQSRA
jgi:hypothetical protein